MDTGIHGDESNAPAVSVVGATAGESSTTQHLDSTSQMGNADGADWQEETYQKIKTLREKHLSEITDLYQRIASAVQQHDIPQHPQNEQIEKLKMFKMTLERIVLFLGLNKHAIKLTDKEKLFSIERHISFFLSSNRLRRPSSSPLQGQLPQSSMQFPQPQSLDGQNNASMQPVQGSMSGRQQNNLTNLQQNSLSGLSTIYDSQQLMMSTVQPGSGVATGFLPQNPVNYSPQQVNISSLSSQSGTNQLQENLGSLQQNLSIPQQSPFELHEQQMLQDQQLRQMHQQMQQQTFPSQQLMQDQQLFHSQQLMQQQSMQQRQATQQQLMLQQQAMQQQSVVQRVGSHHPQLKPGISSSQFHQELSPQWREKLKEEQNATLSTVLEPYASTVEAQMGNANGVYWQEEVYQKIKSLREMYLLELNGLLKKFTSTVQRGPQDEKIENLKMFKNKLEGIVLFLRLNKHEIQLSDKEKLLSVERHISFFLSFNRLPKPTSPLQGPLLQPSMHTSQAQNTYAHQTPTMDSSGQDIASEFD